jgi:hypothetical protein
MTLAPSLTMVGKNVTAMLCYSVMYLADFLVTDSGYVTIEK